MNKIADEPILLTRASGPALPAITPVVVEVPLRLESIGAYGRGRLRVTFEDSGVIHELLNDVGTVLSRSVEPYYQIVDSMLAE